MSEKKIKIPKWFWTVTIFAVLWNLVGVITYLTEVYMSPEAFSRLPDAEQALINSRPAWVTGAYATAVFSGIIGSLLLVFRKKWAREMFIVSLLAVLAQSYYGLFIQNSSDVYGPMALAFTLTILIIGLGLLWFSGYAKRKKILS